jgi:hypothetical protein
MTENFTNFTNAIGTIADLTRLLYDNYLRVGFTSQQAVELAEHVLIAELQLAALSVKGGSQEGE